MPTLVVTSALHESSDESDEKCSMKLIYAGAEAKLYKCEFLGKPALLKERFPKLYRHATLNKRLTYQRLFSESRNILRCRKAGIDCPILYHVAPDEGRMYMEWIEGVTVKCFLDFYNGDTEDLGKSIGDVIARLHNAEMIHGDLTTSNMIIRSPIFVNEMENVSEEEISNHEVVTKRICQSLTHYCPSINDTSNCDSLDSQERDCFKICVIDLGLSYTSSMAEDKAVDLFVLEKAIDSIHPVNSSLMKQILKGYAKRSNGVVAIMRKLEEVRMRGRKRSMVG